MVNCACYGHNFVDARGDTDMQNRSLYSDQLVSLRKTEDQQLYQVRRPTPKLQLGNNEWLLW